MNKPVATIVTLFLIMISLMHLIRLVSEVSVTVGGTEMPLWPSIFGTLIPAALAILLKRESGRQNNR